MDLFHVCNDVECHGCCRYKIRTHIFNISVSSNMITHFIFSPLLSIVDLSALHYCEVILHSRWLMSQFIQIWWGQSKIKMYLITCDKGWIHQAILTTTVFAGSFEAQAWPDNLCLHYYKWEAIWFKSKWAGRKDTGRMIGRQWTAEKGIEKWHIGRRIQKWEKEWQNERQKFWFLIIWKNNTMKEINHLKV